MLAFALVHLWWGDESGQPALAGRLLLGEDREITQAGPDARLGYLGRRRPNRLTSRHRVAITRILIPGVRECNSTML